MHTEKTRLEALRLRCQGRLSLAAVAKKTGISKCTASLWLRDHPLTAVEIRQRMAKSGFSHRGTKWPPAAMISVKSSFSRDVRPIHFREAAIGFAIAWFTHRGYSASLPVGQEPYDLIVDSDHGLVKIQVKSTHRINRWGQFIVPICKRVYDKTRKINASGKRRRAPYALDEVDWFFILTAKQDVYLIPRAVLKSKMDLGLDRAYACYKR